VSVGTRGEVIKAHAFGALAEHRARRDEDVPNHDDQVNRYDDPGFGPRICHSLPIVVIISALFMFVIMTRRWFSFSSAPCSWSRPVTVSPARQAERHIAITKDSRRLLRYYFSNACRLRALRGHQACHHPPASCLGRGRVQNLGEAMCFPFASLSHITSHSIPAQPCTLIRGVCPMFLIFFFNRHDRGVPQPPGFTLPSHSDRPQKLPLLNSTLSHLSLSRLPQGRQVGDS
jgi:hypothetical protein